MAKINDSFLLVYLFVQVNLKIMLIIKGGLFTAKERLNSNLSILFACVDECTKTMLFLRFFLLRL